MNHPHIDTMRVGPVVISVMEDENGDSGITIRGAIGSHGQLVSLRVRADGTIYGASVKEYTDAH
jgi:hypothetical protein